MCDQPVIEEKHMLEDGAMPVARCPFCAQSNPRDAKFCNQCGAQINLVPCGPCGAMNDVKAATCWQCKAALSPAAARNDALPEDPLGPVSMSSISANNKRPRAESMVERLASFSHIATRSNIPPPLSESNTELPSPSSGSTLPVNREPSLIKTEFVRHGSSADTVTLPQSTQHVAENDVQPLSLVTSATSATVNRVAARRWLYVVLVILPLAALGVVAYYAYPLLVPQPARTLPHASGEDVNRPAQPSTPEKPPRAVIGRAISPQVEATSTSGGCTEGVAALGLCNTAPSESTRAQAAAQSSTMPERGAKEPAAACAKAAVALGLCVTPP